MDQIDFRPLALQPADRAVSSFAATNGWQYVPYQPQIALPGLIFCQPNGAPRTSQVGSSLVRIPGPHGIEVGNLAYIEAAQLGPYAVKWGYVATRLAQRLPPVVITVPGADDLPSLPINAARVSLAGTRHTSQASVHGYTTSAAVPWVQRVFGPEIIDMLTLGPPLSLECCGEWLFLYSPGRLSTTSASTWQQILATTEVLTGAIASAGPARTGEPLVFHNGVPSQQRQRTRILIAVPLALGLAALILTLILSLS